MDKGKSRAVAKLATRGLAVLACGSLPLFSLNWQNVLAQSYLPLPQKAQDPNSASVGTAINITCPTGNNGNSPDPLNQQFQVDCNNLVGGAIGDQPGVSGALRSIAINQVSAQNASGMRAAQVQIGVVTSRLLTLRAQSGQPVYALADEPSRKIFSYQQARGGGASADNQFGKLGFFINGKYTSGDEDENDFQTGYDFDLLGVTAGADYRLTDRLVGGIALGYENGDVDYDGDGGDLDVDDYNAHLYASYYLDNGAYFDLLAGYGSTDLDLDRNIRYDLGGDGSVSVRQSAESSTDADRYELSLGAGYNVVRGPWTFTPTARLDYIRNEVDDFREKPSDLLGPGGGLAMRIDSHNYDSLTSNLGGQIAYALSQSWGVLVPQVFGEWVHEFEDDQQSINGTFIGDINNQGFVVKTRRPDTDYFNVGVGASAQFAGGKAAFVSLETSLGYEDVDIYTVRAGFRMEF